MARCFCSVELSFGLVVSDIWYEVLAQIAAPDDHCLRICLASVTHRIRLVRSTLIECDCQIQNVSRFGRAARPQFKGGGGTSFDPVMKWLREHSNSGIGGCIYFTDGAAPRPTIDPRCRVLWVLAPGMEVMHGWRTVGLG
jgi:predicted metal-dependent peptidase